MFGPRNSAKPTPKASILNANIALLRDSWSWDCCTRENAGLTYFSKSFYAVSNYFPVVIEQNETLKQSSWVSKCSSMPICIFYE